MKVAIIDCPDYTQEKVDKAVEKALGSIDGLPALKGKKVLVKVNVLRPAKAEECVTTHPAVVSAICSFLKNQGATIWIGDSSGPLIYGTTIRSLREAGIEEVAKRWKAKLIDFDKEPRKQIKIKNSRMLDEITVAKPVLDADIIISAAKLKTHLLTRYTGAVKNMFGALPGFEKPMVHRKAPSERDFSNALLDIYQEVKPDLAVLDGIEGMEGNGPANGKVKHAGVIMASLDAIALDIVAAEMIGFRKNEIKTNHYGVLRKLTDPKKIKVIGRKRHLDFEKPKTRSILSFASGLLQARPKIDKQVCIKCRTCVKNCPVHAIDGKFDIDYRKCIRCYCCHELCPKDAVMLKKMVVRNLYERIFR